MKKVIHVFHHRIPNPIPLLISVTLLIGIFVSLRYNQSAAWFLNNKNVTASGIQVTIDDPSTATASLTPYAVISIEDTTKQSTA